MGGCIPIALSSLTPPCMRCCCIGRHATANAWTGHTPAVQFHGTLCTLWVFSLDATAAVLELVHRKVAQQSLSVVPLIYQQ